MSAEAVRGPLRRSREHHIIAGVVGGLAEHFGLNVTVLRILYVVVSILSVAFPGILVYLLLWVVVPLEEAPARR